MTTPTLTIPTFRSEKVAFITKSPLSVSGVQSKMEELYSLNEEQLQAQADAVQMNFKSWITDNFFLSGKQKAYLARLDNQTTTYFGSQCSVCFTNRLPIELIYPIPPETDYSKWTGSSNSLVIKSNAEGKTVALGKLIFEFSYTL
ncbi:hypothetical protein [Chryseobacterium sp. ISL-6]|uniref:hypothetical protein n=1 Tax=Chryseobacterium sp. ISL-6 TaxID=2819143 RepID=UPI001BEAA709|nr:hypothetical protein [Chryseobacterium sp. ISL-6]MBT2621926.1 hypothetical protein [Chryseobacterium sp. ISL-6]